MTAADLDLDLARWLAPQLAALQLPASESTSVVASTCEPITAIAFASYGLRLAVRCWLPIPLGVLVQAIPEESTPLAGVEVDRLYDVRPAENAGQRVAVEIDSTPAFFGETETEAIHWIEGDLHHHLATFSRDLLFVHAGVVGWRDRAIVLPGTSFAGKTTLVRALVSLGASYLSDEYAVVDADGLVHPFPRHLRIRTQEGVPEGRLDPLTIGSLERRSLPIGMVAALRYRAEEGWDAHEVGRGAGALALLGNTVAARLRPTDALDRLTLAIRDAIILQGYRGSVDTDASRLLALEHWS